MKIPAFNRNQRDTQQLCRLNKIFQVKELNLKLVKRLSYLKIADFTFIGRNSERIEFFAFVKHRA
jgi:hypothetical protein